MPISYEEREKLGTTLTARPGVVSIELTPHDDGAVNAVIRAVSKNQGIAAAQFASDWSGFIFQFEGAIEGRHTTIQGTFGAVLIQDELIAVRPLDPALQERLYKAVIRRKPIIAASVSSIALTLNGNEHVRPSKLLEVVESVCAKLRIAYADSTISPQLDGTWTVVTTIRQR